VEITALRRRVHELEEQLATARAEAERPVAMAGGAGERARLVAVKGDER
jgi:hypothetical protein